MTAPRFVAGQIVRVNAPGIFGHGEIGMVTDIRPDNIYGVTIAIDSANCLVGYYGSHRLIAFESSRDCIQSPDPRLAIAQALAAAWISNWPAGQLGTLPETVAKKSAELAAIGANELIAQLNKGC